MKMTINYYFNNTHLTTVETNVVDNWWYTTITL